MKSFPRTSFWRTISSTIALRAKRISLSKIPIIPPSFKELGGYDGSVESATDIAQLANAVATRFRGHGSVQRVRQTLQMNIYPPAIIPFPNPSSFALHLLVALSSFGFIPLPFFRPCASNAGLRLYGVKKATEPRRETQC